VIIATTDVISAREAILTEANHHTVTDVAVIISIAGFRRRRSVSQCLLTYCETIRLMDLLSRMFALDHVRSLCTIGCDCATNLRNTALKNWSGEDR